MFFKALERYLTYKCDKVIWSNISRFDVEHFSVSSQSGDEITAVLKRKESPYIVIFSHGNASNITGIDFVYSYLESLGVSYLAYDYPGYGRSSGKPSEAALYESLECIYAYTREELGYEASDIIFHGLSLGGAVTVDIASRFPARACIIESSFTSTHDMGRYMFPALKLYRYVPKRFDSINKIASISMPLLFIHGTEDETVPFEMSELLYQAAKEPKFFYKMDGVGHTDQIELGGDEYIQKILEFIHELKVTF